MLLRITALAALFALCAQGAIADETASLANTIALEQLVDVAQSEYGLHHSRCVAFVDPADPSRIETTQCRSLVTEADPLARPFVHSPIAATLAAGAINVGLRAFGSHVKGANVVLAAVAALYPFVLIHNARTLRIALTFHP